jgi:uncharacterized membrane protein
MTRLERLVGFVLRVGVAVSSACFGVGLALTFVGAGAASTVLHGGIVVLLATPAARVLISVAEYAQQRDWTFTILTLIVLVELTAGALASLR